MKHRIHFLRFAILAALVAAPGALSAQTAYAHLEGGNEEEKSVVTRVEVRNHNYLDVNVFVRSGAQRIRLGSVTGLSTRSLTVPAHLLFGIASLRFELDPVGSRSRPFTNEVTVIKGDEIILTVPARSL